MSSYTFTSQSLFGQKKTFFTPLTPDFNLPHITLFNFIFAKSTVQYYKIFYISYMTFTKKCVLTKDWHPTPIGKKLRKILDYNVVLKKWLSKNLSMTWEIEMNRVAVAVLCCSYCENVSDYKMLPKGNLVLISLIRKKLSFFLDQNPLFSLFLTLLLTFLEKRCCNFLGEKLRKRFHFHEFFLHDQNLLYLLFPLRVNDTALTGERGFGVPTIGTWPLISSQISHEFFFFKNIYLLCFKIYCIKNIDDCIYWKILFHNIYHIYQKESH